MITTVVLTIVLGIVALLDSFLGALLPLKNGTIAFQSMLSLMDSIVFYVRSILPLTVSMIFSYMFLAFAFAVLFKGISFIKRIIPYVNRFGSDGSVGRGTPLKQGVRHWEDY